MPTRASLTNFIVVSFWLSIFFIITIFQKNFCKIPPF
nr:MAG TPA: hypothetical protein [Caudoviricetes sp.]